jgi:hypothetical protein
MSNVINIVIYDKALKFCINKDSIKFNIGSLVNFMQVDSEKLIDCCFYISFIFSFPFQFGIAATILFFNIGYSFCIGLGIILVLFAINFVIGVYLNKYNALALKSKDKRMKLIDEFISGIKMIKLH